jgi:hypothetical protein
MPQSKWHSFSKEKRAQMHKAQCHCKQKVHNAYQGNSSDELSGSPQPGGDIYALYTVKNYHKPIVITVRVNKADLSMELDTGASHSVINEKTFKRFGGSVSKLQNSKVTYTGEKLTILGSAKVEVEHNNQTCELRLVVLKGNGLTLLS